MPLNRNQSIRKTHGPEADAPTEKARRDSQKGAGENDGAKVDQIFQCAGGNCGLPKLSSRDRASTKVKLHKPVGETLHHGPNPSKPLGVKHPVGLHANVSRQNRNNNLGSDSRTGKRVRGIYISVVILPAARKKQNAGCQKKTQAPKTYLAAHPVTPPFFVPNTMTTFLQGTPRSLNRWANPFSSILANASSFTSSRAIPLSAFSWKT